MKFKVGTGAAVTALPTGMMKYCRNKVQKSSEVLKGAGNHRLKVTGQATMMLEVKDKAAQQTVYFVDGLVIPLLGKPVIDSLDLIHFVDRVSLGGGQD